MYVLPIISILGRLPVAGGCGAIPFGYSSCCSNSTHRYNQDLASTDSNRGAGDSCPMYFVNLDSEFLAQWVQSWSCHP